MTFQMYGRYESTLAKLREVGLLTSPDDLAKTPSEDEQRAINHNQNLAHALAAVCDPNQLSLAVTVDPQVIGLHQNRLLFLQRNPTHQLIDERPASIITDIIYRLDPHHFREVQRGEQAPPTPGTIELLTTIRPEPIILPLPGPNDTTSAFINQLRAVN